MTRDQPDFLHTREQPVQPRSRRFILDRYQGVGTNRALLALVGDNGPEQVYRNPPSSPPFDLIAGQAGGPEP